MLFLYYFILFLQLANRLYCLEKVCGEYNSNKLRKGLFSNEKILNEVQQRDGTSGSHEPILCIYKFIAKKNEKVLINFTNFDVKSRAPECLHEYMDIYIELTENSMQNYVETNFLSRFCGSKRPSVLLSYRNIILFAYHSDGQRHDSQFYGTFEFIDAEMYDKNRLTSTNECEYEFSSETDTNGYFMSPTYPGTYPSILECKYKFIGKPNERVMIHFEEISMHYGAEHCPYDSIKVYDILEIKSTTYFDHMQTYCGYKSNITIYSTKSQFQIKFETYDSLGTDEYVDNEKALLARKGFRAYYKFSSTDYVNLDYITGVHVKGTHCDQRIISTGDSTGLIYSPNYPNYYSLNATCKYIFEGLNDNSNNEYYESVKLVFHTYVDTISSNMLMNCNNQNGSYLTVYGSTLKDNGYYCLSNNEIQSSEIKSINSNMILIFNSNNDQANFGFVASYTFFTEFGISGTRVYPNRTCLYSYSSRTVSNGHINSPKYPQNYPINTECVYIFDIQQNERLLFTFKSFKIAQTSSNNQKCSANDDHLSIYQIYDEISDNSQVSSPSLINRFCGYKTPPPILTDKNIKSVKAHFYSNNLKYSTGFFIYYDYLPKLECKYKLISNTNQTYQSIQITQEFDEIHFCEWDIAVDDGQSILFTIHNLNLADDFCNEFILKFYDLNYSNKVSVYDYCIEKDIRHLTIDSSNIQIQLILGNSFYMKTGKVIINWIPAYMSDTNVCNGFECVQSKYCIDSKYYCDRIAHCNDSSDEPIDCGVELKRSSFPFFKILAILSVILIAIIMFSILIIYKITSNLKHQKKKSSHNIKNRYLAQPVFYKYTSASNSVDYLEATITSV